MKICFVIPDGVGIRNYLYTDLIYNLQKQGHSIIVLHNLDNAVLDEVRRVSKNRCEFKRLPVHQETLPIRFLRESVLYARLLHNVKITQNPTILKNWNPIRKKLLKKIYYTAVENVGFLLSGSYRRILRAEKIKSFLAQRSKYIKSYENILEEIRPDILFNTNQRNILASGVFEAAGKRNIVRVNAIYSWDNLPKANMVAYSDFYFVWSAHMKEEIKRYYPEIEREQVFITGTPQFTFYKNKHFYLTKEEFCKRFGFDSRKKIICFSGDDELTSPYDHKYLEDLAEAVLSIPENLRPQILFRRCPVDFSNRYDEILKKYASVITPVEPLWGQGSLSGWNYAYPLYEDVRLLVNIAKHCDTVYNVASTMVHDFAIYDKPGCYIAYDAISSSEWSVHTIYRFEHFKSMKNLDAVMWISKKEEIASKIMKVLEQPQTVARDRQKWLKHIIGEEERPIEKIAELLTYGLKKTD